MGKSTERRPIFIADYQPIEPVELSSAANATGGEHRTGPVFAPASAPASYAKPTTIRHAFPAADEEREGGRSDGYCFRVIFAAGRLERTYEMVVAFLHEQGYGDLPLPADAAELRRFRQPPKLRHQLSMFGDNGYVHNPLKILFPVPAGHRGALVVELYNEKAADHLLRFHRLK